jgi:hypothetical protein
MMPDQSVEFPTIIAARQRIEGRIALKPLDVEAILQRHSKGFDNGVQNFIVVRQHFPLGQDIKSGNGFAVHNQVGQKPILTKHCGRAAVPAFIREKVNIGLTLGKSEIPLNHSADGLLVYSGIYPHFQLSTVLNGECEQLIVQNVFQATGSFQKNMVEGQVFIHPDDITVQGFVIDFFGPAKPGSDNRCHSTHHFFNSSVHLALFLSNGF